MDLREVEYAALALLDIHDYNEQRRHRHSISNIIKAIFEPLLVQLSNEAHAC